MDVRPFPQRHGWLWAALPVGVARVRVLLDTSLAAAVSAAGFEVVERGGESDVTLVALGSDERNGDVLDRALRGAGNGAVGIVIDRAPDRGRHGAARRVLARLVSPSRAAPVALERRRVVRRLARPGMRVRWLPMSDRARTVYGLGSRLWRRGLVPVGAIVWATPNERPTFVEGAVAEAEVALGRTLTSRSMTVVESGKILVEVADSNGERWFLRVAGEPSAHYIANSLHALRTLLGADPPNVLGDRLIEPLADGWVGPVRYSLEPKADGRHPRKMTSALWDDCMQFLIELHRLSSDPIAGESAAVIAGLDADLDTLRHVLGRTEDRALDDLRATFSVRLDGLPLGWEHGDFWPRNMLSVGGRLRAVLDWDTSSAGSLPLLDLYDLISLPASPRRHVHVGARLTRVLLPLARTGGDERIRAYCSATGTPADPGTLTALAAAYWANRAARAIRDWPLRARLPDWVADNLQRPLRELSDA
jgi:aminoglycoside phosphotransferase (APT) family kinase protein